jgi:hypothetical protein
VYRSDTEYEFDLVPTAFQQLIDNVDRDLVFSIEVEGGKKREDIVNYNEVSNLYHRIALPRLALVYFYCLDLTFFSPLSFRSKTRSSKNSSCYVIDPSDQKSRSSTI